MLRNTADVAWDAKVFGAVGSAVGFSGGLLYAWAGQDSIDANAFKVAGLSALAAGLISQVGGMMFVNQQQGGRGLMFTAVGIPTGFGLGSAYAMYSRGSNDPVGIIKAGSVGSIVAGAIGGAGDIVRAQLK
tara:strand:+ start:97 stop:489 length:393 start_codon:yes stop_codon:yes gene_type:complete